MRFLVLIALCMSSTFAFDLNSFGNFYLSTKISNVHFNSIGPTSKLRLKRDVYKRPLEDPNKCIKNCDKAAVKRLNLNNADPEGDETGQKFCKAIESENDCIKACPDSLFRNLMLDFTMPSTLLRYCSLGYNSSDIKLNLDCVNASWTAVLKKCEPNCVTNTSIHGTVNVSPAYVEYNDNKTQNIEALQESCKYIKCSMTCGESIIREKCGQKAFDFEKKYIWSGIGYLVKLYKDMDALDGDVNECQANS